jgi:hypothetical protein
MHASIRNHARLHASMENYELERLDVDLQPAKQASDCTGMGPPLSGTSRDVGPDTLPSQASLFPPSAAGLCLSASPTSHSCWYGSLLNKKTPRRRPTCTAQRYTSRRAAGSGSGMSRPPIFDLTVWLVLFPSRSLLGEVNNPRKNVCGTRWMQAIAMRRAKHGSWQEFVLMPSCNYFFFVIIYSH